MSPIDPALAAIIAGIDPTKNPDDAVETATVWLSFCRGKHVVPIGDRVRVDFGEWYGPTMRLADVVMHVETPDGLTFKHSAGAVGDENRIVEPGDRIVSIVAVTKRAR